MEVCQCMRSNRPDDLGNIETVDSRWTAGPVTQEQCGYGSIPLHQHCLSPKSCPSRISLCALQQMLVAEFLDNEPF